MTQNSSFDSDNNSMLFDDGLKSTSDSVHIASTSPEAVENGSEMAHSMYNSTYTDHDAAHGTASKRRADSLDSNRDGSNGTQREPSKQKSTRGARACTNCHRLKMKCEGAENGGACLRCARSGHECVFLESHRGRKSEKRRKTAAMQQAFKKMENVLFSVLQNMNEPRGANGIPGSEGVSETQSPMLVPNDERATASLSPMPEINPQTQEPDPEYFAARLQRFVAANGLDQKSTSMRNITETAVSFMQKMGMMDDNLRERLLDPNDDHHLKDLLQTVMMQNANSHPSSSHQHKASLSNVPDSARTNCLPDNTLNPLGLLAEASLQNWQRQRTADPASGNGKEREQDTVAKDYSPPGNPPDLMNRYASHDSTGRSEKPQFGLANETYFHSSLDANASLHPVAKESDCPPELLAEGLITSEEALELFSIFFHHCSLHLFLLDPEWHTPTLVCSRSPFLFTCVCSVASKFYTKRPELYVLCLRKAIKSAFDVMSRGSKSPEIVQGFLLLTLYNQPAERYEEDRTWLFAGVAIRMAQDLNLHRKCPSPPGSTLSEEEEREILNRERTWYICFCVDRTLSAQMGKPYSIREDWIIRHASEWCKHKYSRPWDLGICALVDLLRVQTRQLDFLYSSTVTPSGLNLDMDYPAILPSFNEQLNETMQYWYRLGLDSMMRAWRPIVMEHVKPSQQSSPMNGKESEGGRPESDRAPSPLARRQGEKEGGNKSMFSSMPQNLMNLSGGMEDKIRISMLLALHEAGPPGDDADMTTRSMYYIARQAPLRYNYAVLVLNSFGLQYALERPSDGASVDKPQYLVRCVHAAKEIVATVKYGMREILRYAPDPTFVAVAYACVFLLKLIRPVFANYINEDEVIALVNYTIEVLEEAAVDPTHTPALYASFLRSLVQSRHEGGTAKHATEDGARSDAPGAGDDEPHMDGQTARLARIKQMMAARGENSATSSMRGADMTVNPTQVNPVAAGLATSDLRPKPGTDLGELHHGAMGTSLGMPMDSHPALDMHHDKESDMHGMPNDNLNATLGWDAMQFAKAQGVDVNRVLDNSFWSSLLPPGYGSGGMNPISGSSLDPARESDLFKMPPSLNMGFRTTLTPGATRASSPTLGLSSTFPL